MVARSAHDGCPERPRRATSVGLLSTALGLGGKELVALVGGGGKTIALSLLASELAGAGRRVIVTTTTAMLLKELENVGPVVRSLGREVMLGDIGRVMAEDPLVGLVQSLADDGKVVGLPPAAVDRLWLGGWADHLVVEADGSAGRPLKAFASHEPQVPAMSTIIVQVAGLSALGRPLRPEYVHRAQLLADVLDLPLGAEVTVPVFAAALRVQIRRLRAGRKRSHIVTLLTQADCADDSAGLDVARELAGGPAGVNAVGSTDCMCPDAVIVGNLRERRFACVVPAAS